jgi:hypothetical protein
MRSLTALFLATIIATATTATELRFEVLETPGDKASRPNEYRWQVFLLAYDTFSAAIRSGVVRYVDFDKMAAREIPLPKGTLDCDLKSAALRIVLAQDLTADDAKALSTALLEAVAQGSLLPRPSKEEMAATLERHLANVRALKSQIDAEQDPIRMLIVNSQLTATISTHERPRVPFPLRYKGAR